MINTFMAVWNQQRRRRGVTLLLTFLVICISISLLLVTLGDPVWQSLLKAATPPSVVNSTRSVSTPITSITAIPTSVITPTATGTAQRCGTPTSTLLATSTKVNTRVIARTTGAGVGSQGGEGHWTPPVIHKYPTPVPTRRPTTKPTKPPTVSPITQTPILKPDPTALPTVAPTATVAPTQTPISTPTPVATATTVTTPGTTATPDVSPTATVTPEGQPTTTPVSSSTPTATVLPSSTPTTTPTPTFDDDSRRGGTPVSLSHAPATGKNSASTGSTARSTTPQNGRLVAANCLSNSLDLLIYEDALTTVERNIALVLGGGLIGTCLFYGAIVWTKRRKNLY